MNKFSFYFFSFSFILLYNKLFSLPIGSYRKFKADDEDYMIQGALIIARKMFRESKGNLFKIIPIGGSYKIFGGYYYEMEILAILEEKVSFIYQCQFYLDNERDMEEEEFEFISEVVINERKRISLHNIYYFDLNRMIREEVGRKGMKLDYVEFVENFRIKTESEYDFELFLVNVRCNNEKTKRIFIMEKYEKQFTLIGELSDLI